MHDKPLCGLRVGVFGKGGAGKSTVTVFLARALRDLDYSVGAVTCPVDDPTPLPGAELRLEDLPSRFVAQTPEGIYLLVAGKLGGLGPGAGCDGPVAKITRDLRVSGDGGRPVLVVDHKAGFEDAARGALTAVDWAVVAVDPTTAALRMARDLAVTIAAIRHGVPPATRHLDRPELVDLAVRVFREARIRSVVTALCRVATSVDETFLREALESSGAPPVSVFAEDRAVATQWLRGERLRSRSLADAGSTLAQELEAGARG
jgi:hypothetical protein